MDAIRYRNFFYYTEKGYPSYFSNELKSSLNLEWQHLIASSKRNITQDLYLTQMKEFLEQVMSLMKIYKIRKDRIEKFITSITKDLLEGYPKSKSGLRKGFMKGLNEFMDSDKLFEFDTDFTKEWHDTVDHQFEFGFKKIAKKVATDKTTIYLAILGFTSADEITAATIKKKFNKLAMVKHPDKGGNAEEFVAITEAKDYLLEVFK